METNRVRPETMGQSLTSTWNIRSSYQQHGTSITFDQVYKEENLFEILFLMFLLTVLDSDLLYVTSNSPWSLSLIPFFMNSRANVQIWRIFYLIFQQPCNCTISMICRCVYDKNGYKWSRFNFEQRHTNSINEHID